MTDTLTPQATAPAAIAAASASPRTPGARVTLPRVIHSEWIKLVSLRSPWWSAFLVLGLSVGMSTAYAFSIRMWTDRPAELGGNDFIANIVTTPSTFTMLLASILGVILITGEYSTGMIRSTLTAAPDRLRTLIAKAVVLSVFVFGVSILTSAISLLSTVLMLNGTGISYDISDFGTAIAPYLLAALFLVFLALMGLGLGYLIRNGAGALSVVVAIIFVLPVIASLTSMIPGLEWTSESAQFLPMNAGVNLVQGDAVARGEAAIALGLWAVIPLVAGAIVLERRDA